MSVLCILALSTILTSSKASAQDTTWLSPGVKVSYTVDQGMTYGVELSVIRVPDFEGKGIRDFIERGIFIGYGAVFNYDWTSRKSLSKFRVGAEWIGPAVGLEVGPTLVFAKDGTHLGLGVSPWVGTYTLPFYAYTLVFGSHPNLHEVGGYLKLPLCTSGEEACGSDGDSSDIDLD
jgi:hypothetical protein